MYVQQAPNAECSSKVSIATYTATQVPTRTGKTRCIEGHEYKNTIREEKMQQEGEFQSPDAYEAEAG